AQLRVLDATGRLVYARQAWYPAGKQEEVFDWNGASGVFYYELTTPFGSLTRKMVSTRE
ncbi:MAG: hypothetical protein IT260_19015, partial [Saprospiraceae bacterium]|nr:hypothetical protein [Saprospiraceae bacterium]